MIETSALVNARTAMKANRFDEAIPLFETYLEAYPDDVKALLHLGICHLLNRSERRFLAIYEQAVMLIRKLKDVPEEVCRVFAHYEGLVKKVTATALVLGTVATAGCDGVTSSHKYSGGVALDTDDTATMTETSDAGDSDSDTETTLSAHRYSGGVALDTEDSETVTSSHKYSGGVALDTEDSETVTSSHKYSGGVALDTEDSETVTSSHKYSGGVALDTEDSETVTSSHRYSGGVALDTDTD